MDQAKNLLAAIGSVTVIVGLFYGVYLCGSFVSEHRIMKQKIEAIESTWAGPAMQLIKSTK